MKKTVDYYMNLPYTIELHNDPEDVGWFVHVKELRGCMSEGDTTQEALTMIQEALELWLEVALEEGIPIPEPRPEKKGEKGQEMTTTRVVSKSLVRRIGAQVDAPDTIRQRSMEMISSDPDAALLVLKCWHELQHIEEHAQAELEECDTLEELKAWRRKWIG